MGRTKYTEGRPRKKLTACCQFYLMVFACLDKKTNNVLFGTLEIKGHHFLNLINKYKYSFFAQSEWVGLDELVLVLEI
jgi:hypothetical protein